MTGSVMIRLLRDEGWEEVVALERRAYAAGGLSEGEEALRSRHRASPSTCFVLDADGAFGGYLLALPYPLGDCPDQSLLEHGGAPATNLHAHDLVITERVRGRGLSHRMLRHLEAAGRAASCRTLSLVAVHGTQGRWVPLGYRVRPGTPLPASYGPDAVYMVQELHQG